MSRHVKKALAFLMIFAMLFTYAPAPSFADGPAPAAKSFTVKFDPGEGKFANPPAPVTVAENEEVQTPYDFETGATLANKELSGWKVVKTSDPTQPATVLLQKGDQKVAVSELDSSRNTIYLTEDVTLIAQWASIPGGFKVEQIIPNEESTDDKVASIALTGTTVDGESVNYVLKTDTIVGGAANQEVVYDLYPSEDATDTVKLVSGDYKLVITAQAQQALKDLHVDEYRTETALGTPVVEGNTITIPFKLTYTEARGWPTIFFRLERPFTVTYDANGGTMTNPVTDRVGQKQEYDTKYAFELGLTHPTMKFAGWDVRSAADPTKPATVLLDGKPVSELGQYTSKITLTEDVVLVAKWDVTDGLFRIYERTTMKDNDYKFTSIHIKGEGLDADLETNATLGDGDAADGTMLQSRVWVLPDGPYDSWGKNIKSGKYTLTFKAKTPELFLKLSKDSVLPTYRPFMKGDEILAPYLAEAAITGHSNGEYTATVDLDLKFEGDGQPSVYFNVYALDTSKSDLRIHVRDIDGKPLEKPVTFTLLDNLDTRVPSTHKFAYEDGAFTIPALAGGEYAVKANGIEDGYFLLSDPAHQNNGWIPLSDGSDTFGLAHSFANTSETGVQDIYLVYVKADPVLKKLDVKLDNPELKGYDYVVYSVMYKNPLSDTLIPGTRANTVKLDLGAFGIGGTGETKMYVLSENKTLHPGSVLSDGSNVSFEQKAGQTTFVFARLTEGKKPNPNPNPNPNPKPSPKPTPVKPTPKPAPQPTPVNPSPKTGDSGVTPMIIIVVVAVVLLGATFYLRKKKEK